jgi:hypothetical protein
MSDLSHLWLENTAQGVPYTHPGAGGGGEFSTPPRDRLPHAQRLKTDLQVVKTDATATRQQQGLVAGGEGDVIAVRSDPGFELKLDSLERLQSGIELLSVKVEDDVTVAKVFVPRGKYVKLLAIIDDLERFNSRARYALLVSIETPDVNVDLYTPIVNLATVSTAIES